jgi:dTDP-4-dehydrorhamnose reductase
MPEKKQNSLVCFVAGARGMLGRAVARTMRESGFEVVEWDISHGDLSQEHVAERAVREARPHCVVNCAGFTDVEACENPLRAEEVLAGNVLLPRFLARACAKHDALLAHLSTDYIFDGEKPGAYLEDDPAHPLSAYGRSKWFGEIAVRDELPRSHLILRTEWLYGAHGRNFVDTILRKAAAVKQLDVVDDQRGCPTYVDDLAKAIESCVRARRVGCLNAAGAGETTWYGFAKKIIEFSGMTDVAVNPCASDKYPVKAVRPRNSVLNCERLAAACGFRFRPWEEALADYLRSKSEAEK